MTTDFSLKKHKGKKGIAKNYRSNANIGLPHLDQTKFTTKGGYMMMSRS
jgi:hypothetical protein